MKFALRASEVLLRRMKYASRMKCASHMMANFTSLCSNFMSEGHFILRSNTSFFFAYPLDKSEIRAIISQSLGHNRISGGVPEWPKGTDCKSAAFRFDGSNPSSPTTKNRCPQGWRFFVVEEGWMDSKIQNATVRWTVAWHRLDGVNTSIFIPKGNENANESVLPHQKKA